MTDPTGSGYWGQTPTPPPPAGPYSPYPQAPQGPTPQPPYAPQPAYAPQPFVPSWQQQQQPLAPRPAAPTVSFDRMSDAWGAAITTVGVILMVLSLTVLSWVDTYGLATIHLTVTFSDVHRIASFGAGPIISTTYFGWGAIIMFILTTIGAYLSRLIGDPRSLGANLVALASVLTAAWSLFALGLGANVVNIIDVAGPGFYAAFFGSLLIGLGAILPRYSR